MRKLLIPIFIMFSFIFSSCSCKNNEQVVGVWWWDDSLDYETYLTFAKDNGINEIYYCNNDFNESSASFIDKAKEMNIRVYWLSGDYRWLNDFESLYDLIDKYKEYQNKYSKSMFSGIHLDIEPHQDPNFDNNREELITKLVELAYNLNNKYKDITFDYDIPFWLEDEITYNNEKLSAYKHMINISNRVFLMSYRDSAQNIYDISKDEIEYAKNRDKVIVLGVETKSNEGDNVSFIEEGKDYMYQELDRLMEMMPESYGVSIHHIKSWYNMKQ